MSQYIDIHSHLNDARFDDGITGVLARMREASVAAIVVGTDREMSERAIALAEAHDDIWATVGQHPTDTPKEEFDYTIYRTMAERPRVVAIGECGIDYFRIANFEGNKDKEADRQQELFEQHVALAGSVGKPLMVHGRPEKGTMDAYEDILHILKNAQVTHGGRIRGNVHFFVGNTEVAKQFLDMGFTLSFTGVLTFTHEYDEVVRYAPLSSIMSETDAPYVAPIPYRGSRNEPLYVCEVVRAISRIRGENEDVVREQLVENAKRVFNIAL